MSGAVGSQVTPQVRFGASSTPLRRTLVRGEGIYVYDEEERRLLDLFAGAGVCSLGHAHPAFVGALAAQAELLSVARQDTPARRAFVERLGECLPSGLDQLGFFSTGAEAVEAAVRIARGATGVCDVIAFRGAFHGRTELTSALSDPWLSSYPTDPPSVYRLPFPDPYEGLGELEEATEVLRASVAPGAVAAVLVEPVQGTAGNRVPARGFLSLLRALADDLGAALIYDEVFTGFARTGQLFRFEEEAVTPDVLVLGKGMANGVPCSMLAVRPRLADACKLDGIVSSTSFGGNPLAMAAAAATLATILTEDLAAGAARVGERWLELLGERVGELPIVADLRGTGLLIGVELTQAGIEAGLDPSFAAMALLAEGVIVGTGGNALRLNPPLVFRDEDAEAATEAIVRGLGKLEATIPPERWSRG